MPTGKKKFKNTTFGRRARRSARKPASEQKKGVDFLPARGGKRASVQTTTVDLPGQGRRGRRTDVAIVPLIRRVNGKLVRISPTESLATGDFVRVRGGRKAQAVIKARTKGDKKSIKFSDKLGKSTDKATRRSKKK